MATRKVMLATVCFLLTSASLTPQGKSKEPSISISSQTLPIAKHGELICLPVCTSKSNKDALPFLLVTSSDRHIIDARTLKSGARRLGDVDRQTANSRQTIIPIYRNTRATGLGVTLRVGSMHLKGPHPIHVLDHLSVYQAAIGRDFYGMIGAPFLREKSVQIDFDRGTLRIDVTRQLNRRNWASLPLMADSHGLPWATGLQLGGRTESFLLNTGNAESVELHRWLFRSLVRSGHITLTHVAKVTTEAGEETQRQGRLASLTWGPFQHRNLAVLEGEGNSLGLSYLSRFVVVFDMPGKRIFLRRGACYNKSDLLNDTGIQVLMTDGTFVICSVETGSPAEIAGVLKNDEMTTINGRAVVQMSLYSIRRVLREAHGKCVTLSLKRKGSVVKVSFVVPVDSTLAKESGKKEKKPGPGAR